MADRSISVRVNAVVTDFQRAMGQATGDLKGFQRQAQLTGADVRQSMTTVGIAAAGAGLAIAGGLGAGVKAAIDWESAFAGVIKTVDATTAELDMLEQGLRDMAQEIPVTHEELAGIAEAAGQLGIQTDNILGFTETMAALGVATNLTSEEAATMFARFANITGLPQDQIENLGSAVVDLGNNLATTEAEIGEMSLRIAGAGTQIGLTEAEILGFAGALSSVGIEAQAGGTAISRVFVEVDKSVRSGGETLAAFAETAGMTVDEFTRAYQDDAAGAIVTFIEGLDRISSEGGNVFGVLEDLELQDIRVRDALLRAAGAGDLFRESIERSTEAFGLNVALSKEAEQRYGTVESQIQIAKNALVEMGIGIGEVLLPVLVPLIEGARDMAKWFADLPDPVKNTAVALAGVSAVMLTISGTALILIPRILQLAAAYKTLAGTAAAAASAQGASAGAGTIGAVRGSATFGGGKLATVGKAGVVGAAAVSVGVAVKEGLELADQIGQGNQELSAKVRDLMLAAEKGDQLAADRLGSVRRDLVEDANWFEQNVLFWTPEFVANRAFLTAAEDIEEVGRAAGVSAADMGILGGAMNQIPDVKGVAADMGILGGAMNQIPDRSDVPRFFRDMGDEAANAAPSMQDMAKAAHAVRQAMLEAANPVFAAVEATKRLKEAEEKYQEVLDEPEATEQEMADAALNLAGARLEADAALTALGSGNKEAGIRAIADALGVSYQNAEDLLITWGLLDAAGDIQKNVDISIDPADKALLAHIEHASNTTGQIPVNVPAGFSDPGVEIRAAGGPVRRGSMYRVGEGNQPELLKTPSGLFMVPGDSGHMFSNAQSDALISAISQAGANGGNITINLHGTGDVARDMGTVTTMAGVMRRVETSRR